MPRKFYYDLKNKNSLKFRFSKIINYIYYNYLKIKYFIILKRKRSTTAVISYDYAGTFNFLYRLFSLRIFGSYIKLIVQRRNLVLTKIKSYIIKLYSKQDSIIYTILNVYFTIISFIFNLILNRFNLIQNKKFNFIIRIIINFIRKFIIINVKLIRVIGYIFIKFISIIYFIYFYFLYMLRFMFKLIKQLIKNIPTGIIVLVSLSIWSILYVFYSIRMLIGLTFISISYPFTYSMVHLFIELKKADIETQRIYNFERAEEIKYGIPKTSWNFTDIMNGLKWLFNSLYNGIIVSRWEKFDWCMLRIKLCLFLNEKEKMYYVFHNHNEKYFIGSMNIMFKTFTTKRKSKFMNLYDIPRADLQYYPKKYIDKQTIHYYFFKDINEYLQDYIGSCLDNKVIGVNTTYQAREFTGIGYRMYFKEDKIQNSLRYFTYYYWTQLICLPMITYLFYPFMFGKVTPPGYKNFLAFRRHKFRAIINERIIYPYFQLYHFLYFYRTLFLKASMNLFNLLKERRRKKKRKFIRVFFNAKTRKISKRIYVYKNFFYLLNNLLLLKYSLYRKIKKQNKKLIKFLNKKALAYDEWYENDVRLVKLHDRRLLRDYYYDREVYYHYARIKKQRRKWWARKWRITFNSHKDKVTSHFGQKRARDYWAMHINTM